MHTLVHIFKKSKLIIGDKKGNSKCLIVFLGLPKYKK